MIPVHMYQVPPAEMRVLDAAEWHFTAGGAVIRVPYGYSDEETLAAMIHELPHSSRTRSRNPFRGSGL